MGERRQCGNEAIARYTWPGREESFICADHLPQLRVIACAMGLPLQCIPLVPDGAERDRQSCRQQVSSR